MRVEKAKEMGSVTKHGQSKTRLFYTWSHMEQRCYNHNDKRFENYGGRGIIVCSEWLDKEKGFINFRDWAMANGYQDDLTLDRINVNGNYESSNCRWVDMTTQNRNKRTNIYLTFGGKTQTLSEWSREKGWSPQKLRYRINSGWSVEKALTTP